MQKRFYFYSAVSLSWLGLTALPSAWAVKEATKAPTSGPKAKLIKVPNSKHQGPDKKQAEASPITPHTKKDPDKKTDEKATAQSVAQNTPQPPAAIPTLDMQINTQDFNLDGCIQVSFARTTDAQIVAFFYDDAFWFLTTDACRFKIPNEMPAYVQSMDNLVVQGGSGLRLRIKKGIIPHITQSEKDWTIELGEKRYDIPEDLQFQYNPAPQTLNILKLTGKGLGRIIGFQDQFGQLIIAITHPDLAVRQKDYNREFDIIPTLRGLVLLPHQNDFRIDAVGAGEFLIRSLHSQVLSSLDDRHLVRNIGKPPGLLNLMKWDLDSEVISDLLVVLKQKLYLGSPTQRKRAYMDLAEFYLANGFYPETLGVIDTVQNVFPEERQNDALNMMYDLADVLAHNYKDYDYVKSGDALSYESESDIIRGIDLIKHGNYLEGANALSQALKIIQNLPAALRNDISMLGFEASVMQKMGGIVFYNFITPNSLSASQQDYVRFLDALQLKNKGDLRSSLQAFLRLTESPNPKVQLLARLESIDLKKEPPSRSIPILEGLRNIWRGDAIEYRLLAKLFELYSLENKPWQALSLLYTLNDFFPNFGTTEDRMVQGQNLFYKTFKTADFPPLRQLGFYNEFQNFIPQDDRYIEVHQILFDTLFKMDLVDQATQAIANVMRDLPQMITKHKLNPESGTRFFHDCALKLANFHLQEEKPAKALRILENLNDPNMTADVKDKSLFMKAQAYYEMGHLNESTQVLVNLPQLKAKQLLGAILMKQQKWAEAQQVLEPLLKDKPPVDVVINMAIIYQSLQNSAGLENLRKTHASTIKDPKKKEALLLLTSTADAPKPLSKQEIANELKSTEELQKMLKDVR